MSAPESDKAGIRQTVRALRAAGYELDGVDDGDYEEVTVTNEDEAVNAVTAVDDARLYVKKDGSVSWVRFVMGNSPEEVICDHTTDLSPVLDPLTDKWFE